MRNIIKLLTVILLVSGCVMEDLDQGGLKSFDFFMATVEDIPSFKASLADNGEVQWTVGDCIGVFSDMQAPTPYYLDEDGRFRGPLVTGNVFYAYYPYTGVAYDSENPTQLTRYGITMPTYNTQEAPMFMVAKAVGNQLTFKQTGSLLKFKIRSEQRILGVTLRSNNDEVIQGVGTVDVEQDIPHLQLNPTGSHSSSVSVSNDADAPDDDIWVFYFPLPPMTFSEGFTLSIQYAPNNQIAGFDTYSKSTSNVISLARSQMRVFSLEDPDQKLEEERQVYIRERDALMAIYEALDGEHWTNMGDWGSDTMIRLWDGVVTNEDGRVTSLILNDPKISGTLPDVFDSFPELTSLFATGRGLTGSIPASIGSCINLRSIEFIGCSISGNFPETMRNLVNLETLNVIPFAGKEGKTAENCLSGSLPAWINEWQALKYLYLGGNLLSGELPSGLAELSHLEQMVLNDNAFTGPLPNVEALISLRELRLQNCFFSGSLPASYAGLLDRIPKSLCLQIKGNRLTGVIPDEIFSHPRFGEFAPSIIAAQQTNYGLTYDATKIPATRRTYSTLTGEEVNLGSIYANNDYTLLYRWSTSSYLSAVMEAIINRYAKCGLYRIGLYRNGGADTDESRTAYMERFGLDQWPLTLDEDYIYDASIWDTSPSLIEVVNREGNIVFLYTPEIVDADSPEYIGLPFVHNYTELEECLYNWYRDYAYTSVDYSSDGQIHNIKTATRGAGIDIILMGDAFTDRDVTDGTYGRWMQRAADAFFDEEPYRSFQDCFNVYSVDIVSPNDFYGTTAFSTYFGEGTYITGNHSLVIEYAQSVIGEERMDDALAIVVIKHDEYSGTCHMFDGPDGDYGRGFTISYCPAQTTGTECEKTIHHEACGHGFAKLADEYASQPEAIPENVKAARQAREVFGWWKNADFTNNPNEVKWSRFLSDERYADENLGCYEGGFTYRSGVWHPTEISIMRSNTGGFNAPSRYAIWYRINKLAFGTDCFDGMTPEEIYEEFVTFDLSTRPAPAAAAAARHRSYVEKPFVPLAPPVIHEGAWREMR